jgi:hypothetical protein
MERSPAIQRFQIKSVEGPFDRGTLNQFHDYVFEIELDPGGVYRHQFGRVGIRYFDTAYWALWSTDLEGVPLEEQAKARVAHYVIQTLRSVLPTSASVFPLSLQPTVAEVESLRSVDPTKVDISAWYDVPTQALPRSHTVFISCGQSSEEERSLGRTIARLVAEKTGFEGYFAQNQQTLQGVTRGVFDALQNAAGFIAIMHRRDQLSEDSAELRGSVWVEQEIAIAAFMVQSLGLRLPCRAYVQRGIRREGVRGFILLNSVEFDTPDEILADLESFWSELTSQPRN